MKTWDFEPENLRSTNFHKIVVPKGGDEVRLR
jgi:hypothetical protein